ncbi:hypothetical protein B0H19DRAFT_1079615 [Mycena capillaripes]|nr:hypothetical protein B0H19DRAFT_1079615 [Mycena capillaripes]
MSSTAPRWQTRSDGVGMYDKIGSSMAHLRGRAKSCARDGGAHISVNKRGGQARASTSRTRSPEFLTRSPGECSGGRSGSERKRAQLCVVVVCYELAHLIIILNTKGKKQSSGLLARNVLYPCIVTEGGTAMARSGAFFALIFWLRIGSAWRRGAREKHSKVKSNSTRPWRWRTWQSPWRTHRSNVQTRRCYYAMRWYGANWQTQRDVLALITATIKTTYYSLVMNKTCLRYAPAQFERVDSTGRKRIIA